MDKVRSELKISERRACAALGQHRSTQRKPARGRDDEAALTADIIELAKTYGRYGYRRVTALLRHAGWAVNAKRVERIWRQEGLKVPQKQPKPIGPKKRRARWDDFSAEQVAQLKTDMDAVASRAIKLKDVAEKWKVNAPLLCQWRTKGYFL